MTGKFLLNRQASEPTKGGSLTAVNTGDWTRCFPPLSTIAGDKHYSFPSSIAQHFLATVSFRGFTYQGIYGARTKGIPTGAFGTLFNDPRSHTFDNERYQSIGYQHSIRKGWDVAARTSVSRYVYDGTFVYGPDNPGGADVVNYDFARGTWWSGELKLQQNLERNNLSFGTEVHDNPQQDQCHYNI